MKMTKMQKMNQLPVHAVMTTKELKQRGFTNQDLTRAGKEGVLVHYGYGVWARHVPLCLYEALKTFQKESQSCHIGGRTILHLLLGAPKPERIQLFDHREAGKYPNAFNYSGRIQTVPCRIFNDEYFLMNVAVSSNVTDCTGLLLSGHCLRALT